MKIWSEPSGADGGMALAVLASMSMTEAVFGSAISPGLRADNNLRKIDSDLDARAALLRAAGKELVEALADIDAGSEIPSMPTTLRSELLPAPQVKAPLDHDHAREQALSQPLLLRESSTQERSALILGPKATGLDAFWKQLNRVAGGQDSIQGLKTVMQSKLTPAVLTGVTSHVNVPTTESELTLNKAVDALMKEKGRELNSCLQQLKEATDGLVPKHLDREHRLQDLVRRGPAIAAAVKRKGAMGRKLWDRWPELYTRIDNFMRQWLKQWGVTPTDSELKTFTMTQDHACRTIEGRVTEMNDFISDLFKSTGHLLDIPVADPDELQVCRKLAAIYCRVLAGRLINHGFGSTGVRIFGTRNDNVSLLVELLKESDAGRRNLAHLLAYTFRVSTVIYTGSSSFCYAKPAGKQHAGEQFLILHIPAHEPGWQLCQVRMNGRDTEPAFYQQAAIKGLGGSFGHPLSVPSWADPRRKPTNTWTNQNSWGQSSNRESWW